MHVEMQKICAKTLHAKRSCMLTPVFLYQGEFLPIKNLTYKAHNLFLNKKTQNSIISLGCNTESSNNNMTLLKNSSKPIIIFIGGFLDSIHQVVFREFAGFSNGSYSQLSHISFVAKIYSTFSCKKLFSSLLPEILALGYVPYIISHSWGASNICKAISTLNSTLPNNSIPLLLTLDPVSYWRVQMSMQCVDKWINIYIADKWRHCFNASNICTFIGRAWNECKNANINISLDNQHSNNMSDKNTSTTPKKTLHHASVRRMLQCFNATNFNFSD